MRLDVFLKLSRLVPRRAVAQEFCDKGLVTVNGLAAKSSKEIKSGDRIGIRRRNTVTIVSVTDVPSRKQLSKAEAQTIYEIVLTETIADADLLA